MSKAERVLIFIDHFLPGYKAGGPVRSCANMITRLQDRFEFFVVTSDREYMEDAPFPNVEVDRWNEGTLCPIYYASPSKRDRSVWVRLIEEVGPDVVYINGVYSYRFSILPLQALRKLKGSPRTILAPRGMLAPGAMSVKPLKKRLFLWLAKAMGLFKEVIFHSTHDQEKEEIRYWIGANEVRTIPNLPPGWEPTKDPGIEKQPGSFRLISIARIAPEKNTLELLELLAEEGKPGVELDLFGPVYDENYWARCQRVIERMPEGVVVRHEEGVPPDRALRVIREHHAFILLTKGENFGHAILEALLAGRPVLISDRTPWKRVEEAGVGRFLHLGDRKRNGAILREFLEMDRQSFEGLTAQVRSYASELQNCEEEERAYELLLKGA